MDSKRLEAAKNLQKMYPNLSIESILAFLDKVRSGEYAMEMKEKRRKEKVKKSNYKKFIKSIENVVTVRRGSVTPLEFFNIQRRESWDHPYAIDHPEIIYTKSSRYLICQPFLNCENAEEDVRSDKMISAFLKSGLLTMEFRPQSESWYYPERTSIIVFKKENNIDFRSQENMKLYHDTSWVEELKR